MRRVHPATPGLVLASTLACAAAGSSGAASAQNDDVSLSDENVARLGSFSSRPQALPPESEHVLSLSLRGGAMATDDQRQVLTFNREGAAATLTGGLRPLPWIAGELSLGGLVVGSTDEAAGGLVHASLGLRLMPRLDRFTPFARVSFGVGLTGLLVAPVFEGGVGFWIDLADEWSAGPEVAVTHVVWEDGPMRTSDAVFVSGGVVLAFRPRPTPATQPADRERVVVRDRVRVETRLLRVPPAPPSDPETLMRLVDRAVPATVTRSIDSLVPPLLFEHDDTELSSCGEASLYDLLRAIDEAPPDTHLVVEGHADGSGADTYNRALSTRRAEAVRRFLVEHGVARDRIEIRAHGEGAPLVDETDDRALSLNRRVVVHFERTTSSPALASDPEASVAPTAAEPASQPATESITVPAVGLTEEAP